MVIFHWWNFLDHPALGTVKKIEIHKTLFILEICFLIMHHTIWYKASWIFTINSDSWSLQPHSPPRRIIQRPNHHVVYFSSTPLHNIKLGPWESATWKVNNKNISTLTCQVFKHATRHKAGLRAVYFHLRQTQAALPNVYGFILVKICWNK